MSGTNAHNIQEPLHAVDNKINKFVKLVDIIYWLMCLRKVLLTPHGKSGRRLPCILIGLFIG